MNTRRALLVISLPIVVLLCVSTPKAEVFKQIDADGNVTFTDVAKTKNEKALKVAPPAMTYKPIVPKGTGVEQPGQPMQAVSGAKPQNKATQYYSLEITNPTNDAVIRANGGSFAIQLAAQPTLDAQANHRFVVLLDGKKHQASNSSSIVLNNVDRGLHTIRAQILNSDDKVLMESGAINIQILRVSILNRSR